MIEGTVQASLVQDGHVDVDVDVDEMMCATRAIADGPDVKRAPCFSFPSHVCARTVQHLSSLLVLRLPPPPQLFPFYSISLACL